MRCSWVGWPLSCRYVSVMKKSQNFIEREVFDMVLRRVDGKQFLDADTVYGDMSRLVVAWLAGTPPNELRALYNKWGWKGDPNVRAIHEAAKAWLVKHHKGRFPVVEVDDE
jgi:hypothetical protein